MAAASVQLSSNASSATAMQLVGSNREYGVWLTSGGDSLSLPVPVFDETYTESPDTEGGRRSRSRPSVPKGSMKVNISGPDAATFWSYVRQWQQLVNEIHDYGGILVYTPVNGNTVTYDLESIFITDMPQENDMQSQNFGSSAVDFTTLPYGRLATITNATLSDIDTFWRDSITNQEWRYDAGATTLSTSGGSLAPSSTAEKRIIRPLNVIDVSQAVIKVTTGASVASGDTGITLKRLDANNEIRARVEFAGASSLLRIAKFDAAVATNLGNSANFTTAAGTSYWLQASMVGNVVTVKLFSQDPNAVTNPAQVGATLSFTLTAGDATKFGSGVKGSPGLRLNPQATDYRWDDWRVDSGSMEGFDPILNFELLNVPGSASALAKLRLTDMAAQPRFYVEWGLEDHNYEKATPQPTMLDSDALSTTGMAGAGTTVAGAYDPGASGNSVIRATLPSAGQYGTGATQVPVPVCTTGPVLGHVGTVRIKTRAFVAGTGPVYLRAAYRIGTDGAWSRTSWVKQGTVNAFYEKDLGAIRIPRVLLGTQTWELKIEAYSASGVQTDTVAIDYIRIVPAKRYGKAKTSVGAPPPAIGGFTALDTFDQVAGALGGKTANIGGLWTTAGAVTDFTVDATSHVLTRNANDASFRTATLPVSVTDFVESLDFKVSAFPGGWFLQLGHNAFADTMVVNDSGLTGGLVNVLLNGSVSGAAILQLSPNVWYTATMMALGSLFLCWVTAKGASLGAPLLTGNITTPAAGNLGFREENLAAGASNRTYDNFTAYVPAAVSDTPQPVIPSGGYVEVRHNAVVRPGGSRITPEGAYMKVDPSGKDGRGAQVVATARRNDIDLNQDSNIADALKAEVDLTPRVVLLDG